MSKQQKMKCPFCAEEILVEAKKCKHCGEWLEGPMIGTGSDNKSTIDAEVIAKGIEQAEYNKTATGCLMIIIIGIAFIVGLFTHWVVGLIVFIALGMWTESKRHK